MERTLSKTIRNLRKQTLESQPEVEARSESIPSNVVAIETARARQSAPSGLSETIVCSQEQYAEPHQAEPSVDVANLQQSLQGLLRELEDERVENAWLRETQTRLLSLVDRWERHVDQVTHRAQAAEAESARKLYEKRKEMEAMRDQLAEEKLARNTAEAVAEEALNLAETHLERRWMARWKRTVAQNVIDGLRPA